MLKKVGIALLGLTGGLLLLFVLGPRPNFDQVDTTPFELGIGIEQVENYIHRSNQSEPTLKPDNGAQLYWVDSIGQKTDYVLLFLHGFSGTHHEANPMHKEFGKRYGMNTYLHRIEDHGISDPDAFEGITPKDLLESAKEGIALAKLLGDKVVIMSCSTGGTYAAYLAQNDADISHLIFLSPNIALADPTAAIITGPWGSHLLKNVFGNHRTIPQSEEAAKYWQVKYHTDGILALQSLIDQTMTEEVFSNITQPTFLGCYYKDDDNQDFVVSVPAMRDFFDAIRTDPSDKQFVEFPNANDHVVSSPIKAQHVEEVRDALYAFGDQYFELSSTNQ